MGSIGLPPLIMPKKNQGWQRKPNPLSLKSLALKVVMESIISSDFSSKPDQVKAFQREDIKKELPQELLSGLADFVGTSFLKPEYRMTIMESLPLSTYMEKIDFMGKYRGTHCCLKGNNYLWVNGVATECLLDLPTLKRMSGLFHRKSSHIKKIALWTERDVIRPSRFHKIIARSPMLSSLTLRGDADDQVLKIIGINCSFLKYLDVSRSPKLTEQGLWNLTLQNPKAADHANAEKYRIVESLSTVIITVDHELDKEIIDLFGKIFSGSSYYIQFDIPDCILTIERTSTKLEMPLHECFEGELLRDLESLIPFDLENPDAVEVDIYKPNSSEYVIRMFDKETRFLDKTLKVDRELGILELLESWENRHWTVSNLIDLEDIAFKAKNLKKLSCRIYGTWDAGWGVLFPYLQEFNCWCLWEDSVRAVLKYAPSLRKVDVKHIPRANGSGLLTHGDLLQVLDTNVGMKNCLEEFTVRPTNLTRDSVLEIHRQCPKIRRIGDLECWDVNDEEIEEVNKALYKSNSQCVLVILDYPPSL